ncbi:aspartyl/asparaginyl beta-hydroxylase domain-containing protein [Sphingomonas arantia]|uniref:Aspartyl/asparaginyl beta-hydroxylase domain-containing protein n=1 Tax=Sphingomonas arantia TaxID=1460676 RepID=A0ABW4TTE2_9SPHN
MNSKVQQLLADATAAQGAGRGQESARLFRAVLAVDQNQPIALNALGIQALGAGRLAEAVALTRRATQADPGEPILWINLARAQREAGDRAGERASLDAALAIDPRRFIALLRKAQWLESSGDLANAAQTWSAALAMAPPEAQRPPGLASELAAGAAFVRRQGSDFAQEVDAGLADARATLDGAERRRFDACVDTALGRRRIFHPECAGLHFPFLPADEFFPRTLFPWLAELEAHTPAIRAEYEALVAGQDASFVPYVTQPANTPVNPWSGLNNRLDWSVYYLWRFGVAQAEAHAACPATAAALAAVPLLDIPERGPTAFYSLLKPGVRIPPHSGVTNSRAIVHLPLIVPEACGFRVGGETRRWTEGEAFVFDDTIEHEAWNDSETGRVVLIMDVWNPHLTEAERTLLRTYFAVIDASEHKPDLVEGL